MKKWVMLSIPALAIVTLVAAPVLAGEYGEKRTQPGAKEVARPQSLTATVVSVDRQARTLTVKDAGEKPAEHVFSFDEKQAPMMADLKAGDKIELSYISAEGKQVATSIRVLQRAKPGA